MIGQSNYIGFGFTTLNGKPLCQPSWYVKIFKSCFSRAIRLSERNHEVLSCVHVWMERPHLARGHIEVNNNEEKAFT